MDIFINGNGIMICLYNESFPIRKLGKPKIKRFTKVEFNNETDLWEVRLFEKNALLYMNKSRKTCLRWEEKYFTRAMEGKNK